MKKDKRIGFVGAGMIAAASLLSGAAQKPVVVNPVSQQTQNQSNKDAVVNKVKTEVETNKKGLHGGLQNPYKHQRTPKKNQRQIRKWKRQNPNSW